MADSCNLSSSSPTTTATTSVTSSDCYWILDNLTSYLIDRSFCLGYIIVVMFMIALSIILNMLLMIAILKSPSLNTQPNSFLVSICVNNILVSVAAVLEVVNVSHIYINTVTGPYDTTYSSSNSPELSTYSDGTINSSQIVTTAHNVLLDLSLMSYLMMFLVVSYYKSCVAEDPYMPYSVRRTLVIKLLITCWSCSTLASLLYCTIWLLDDCVRTNYIGAFLFNIQELVLVSCTSNRLVHDFNLTVLILHYAFTAISTILIIITLRSVINVGNMFPTSRSSRVAPQNDSSPPSAAVSPAAVCPNTAWTSGDTVALHAFSCGTFQPNIYKLDSAVSEISATAGASHLFSVKNYGQLEAHQQQELCSSNVNSSFTDLSKERSSSSDLLSDSHNNTPSKYTSGLGKVNTSIRNIVAMLIMFFILTTPAVIVSIPYATSQLAAHTRIYLTLAVKAVFYVNSIAYPIWYFTFTQKVRKMLLFSCDN